MQKGFTLIELMIVIAIIGILATIALPNYQDYIAKTQATEALKVTEGLKTDIALFFWGTRTWPKKGNAVMATATQLDGKYFDPGEVIVEPDTGKIITTFSSGVNAGKTVVLTPTANAENGQLITWHCSGTVGIKHLPSSCQ